jgi:hypothetical protein
MAAATANAYNNDEENHHARWQAVASLASQENANLV